MIGLTEDGQGNPAEAMDSAAYATTLELTGLPVTADVNQRLVDATPWTGLARPGKCVLTPAMEMLFCYVGENDDNAYAAIIAHAGSR